MKIISVIKLTGAALAASSFMYATPTFAQYFQTMDSFNVSGSSCYYNGTCSGSPEVPFYIWTIYNSGSGGYFRPQSQNTNYGTVYASDAQIAARFWEVVKGLPNKCQKPGETQEDWFIRQIQDWRTQQPFAGTQIAAARTLLGADAAQGILKPAPPQCSA
jgi:hypothetical protein